MKAVLDLLTDVATAESGHGVVKAEALWAVLEAEVGQAALADALGVVNELTADEGDPDAATRAELLQRFATIRRIIPPLIEGVPFGAAEDGVAVLAEFRRLPELFPRRRRRLATSEVNTTLVGPSWRRLVLANPDLPAGQVDQRAYTASVLEAFHARLRRRDVFVLGGLRWSDPRGKLLDGVQWRQSKPEVLASLELPEDPDTHLDALAARLDAAYRLVAAHAATGEVTPATVDAGGRLHLARLDPLDTPGELTDLARRCQAMLPRIDLPDLITEVHGWTGCLDAYTHLSEAEARMSDLPTSVAACLVAEGCNVGFAPIIQPGHPALSRARLSHVNQNYLRAENHSAANASLIDAQAGINLVSQWGTGQLASVDGCGSSFRQPACAPARTPAISGSAARESLGFWGIRMRTRLADDADEFRVDLGSGAVVDPSRWEGTTMSTMTSVRTNGVELGVETFGRDADPLVLLAGGTTMLSWPDSVCERLAAGGRWVVRYDLRDCGASTTFDPEAPAYRLRDLAADAAALVDTLGAATAHLGGVGVGGMVAQVAALDHPKAFSALTLVSTRPVAPGPVDDDLPDHDAATMDAVFSRPMPDWTDRAAVAAFAADGAELLGNDPEQARATAARIWDRTPSSESAVQQANQLGMVFARLDCTPRWRERLGELTLPTLVVHGRADPFFPVGNGEALAATIPAARLLVLDDMGTALRDAAADKVAGAMLAL